ncbi:unnamed protein product [Urochloa humidicola]
MDDTLQAKCARIKTLKLPSDSTDGYGFPVCSPLWSSGINSDSDVPGSFGTYSDSDDCIYGDYILDSDEYDVYWDPFRYLNGVGICEDELGPEQRMFLKGMRELMRRKRDPVAATGEPAVECARCPAMVAPWLPPPASFSRKLDPAAAADAPVIKHARGLGPAVAAPWLPPPAAFARRLGSAPPNSSSSRCSRGREADECQGARGWVALPRDALMAVLRKLDHIEILMGPGQVCHSWRRAARDDPALWCRINMRGHADLHRRVNLCMMAKDAIRLAKGQCEEFWAEYAADDGVLQLLGKQAPSLKSLRLISCQDIIGFEEEIKKFPLLEELEISLFTNIGGKHVFQAVGQACPKLKHFRFNSYRFINIGNREHSDDSDDDDYYDYDDNNLRYKDDDAMGIASMHGLRTLQLFGNSLTNEGLTAILDNCPYLESLDICHCFNIIMDDTLQAKCARIKMLTLPADSTDDYGYPVCCPLWSSGIDSDGDAFGSLGTYSDSDDCVYGDYILGSDEYDDYCDPFRYLNGVYEDELGPEDRMFLKGMRMLMRDDDDY